MAPRAVVARLAVLVVLLASAGACGPGGTLATASPAVEAATPAQAGAAPPKAELQGAGGAPVPGDLGTFSWDGLVSDAPWVVSRPAVQAGSRQVLSVLFAPPTGPTAWQARWAPVAGGQAGDPVDAGRGTVGPIVVTTPPAAGGWSLQLRARFGQGRDATWYWRVEVAP